MSAHTTTGSPGTQELGGRWSCSCGRTFDSVDGQPSHAIIKNRDSGRSGVSGARPDRSDHELVLVGRVDFAHSAVGHRGPDELGFGEVAEPVNASGVKIFPQEHRARRGRRRREHRRH
jgi:hypothetical protein